MPATKGLYRRDIDRVSCGFCEGFTIHVGKWGRPAGTPAGVPLVSGALIRWCRDAQPPATSCEASGFVKIMLTQVRLRRFFPQRFREKNLSWHHLFASDAGQVGGIAPISPVGDS